MVQVNDEGGSPRQAGRPGTERSDGLVHLYERNIMSIEAGNGCHVLKGNELLCAQQSKVWI